MDRARYYYGYDYSGNRQWQEDPVASANSTNLDMLYAYDGLNRLTTYDRGDINAGHTAITTLAFAQDWELDQLNNWSGFDEDSNGNGTNELVQDRTHNDVNEITAITATTGANWVDPTYDGAGNMLTGPTPGAETSTQKYVYDAGNRTVKNDGSRTTYVYDAANQLSYAQAAAGRTTYAFDAAGNQTLEQTPAGARTTTTWSYEQQPAVYQIPAGSRVTLSYTADNRRVQKQTAAATSSKYVWDPVMDAYFSELDNGDANQLLYTQEPVRYGNLIIQQAGGTPLTPHQDALGSTRVLTSAAEAPTDTFVYDAWGGEVARTGTSAAPFRWVGGVGYYYDTETGLYYVRARVYQPAVARWTSVDPQYPEILQLAYRYSESNGVRYIDPSGFFASITAPCKKHCRSLATYYLPCVDDCLRCRKLLDDWVRAEEDAGNGWLQSLPDCPCTLTKRTVQPPWVCFGAGGYRPQPYEEWVIPPDWYEDQGTLPGVATLVSLRLGFDIPGTHPGAEICIRYDTDSGASQQCCYDDNGNLIKSGMPAGTVDKNAPDHWNSDVVPWACALLLDGFQANGRHFREYLKHRPQNQGDGC